jgi:L-seryl-tRNA(Ser) seleniumtransferase
MSSRSASSDPRRLVPSTDLALGDVRLAPALERLGRPVVRDAVRAAQERIRAGDLAASALVDDVLLHLPATTTSLRPVLNATGVVLHTNLGRAALSSAALEAIGAASGYSDVEYDLGEGTRGTRGRGALAALRTALPDAEDVLIVNSGAAALLLAMAALAGGREVLWSRGEMIEIGDGFRLPDLVAASGAIIREVGTTNRTKLADYAAAMTSDTACILKVHLSNFTMQGFTNTVTVNELAALGPPVIADVGSGLLLHDPLLPAEPDLAGALRSGAALVIASGDKLLGGPQAGVVAGRADLVAKLRRHPMYRAVRVSKLILAALEATLVGPPTPTALALRVRPDELFLRAQRIVDRLDGVAMVAHSAGAVGGGSAPGVELSGWAISLPERYAALLRRCDPAVIGRIEDGRCLLDLRCVPAADDEAVLSAITACT